MKLTAPPYLNEIARAEFERVVRLRPFAPTQLVALTTYACSFAAWQAESAAIQLEGSVVTAKGSRGQTVTRENPRLLIADRHQKLMLRAQRLLGLHRPLGDAAPLADDDWNPFEALDDAVYYANLARSASWRAGGCYRSDDHGGTADEHLAAIEADGGESETYKQAKEFAASSGWWQERCRNR
jgi:phage terminase small subunit